MNDRDAETYVWVLTSPGENQRRAHYPASAFAISRGISRANYRYVLVVETATSFTKPGMFRAWIQDRPLQPDYEFVPTETLIGSRARQIARVSALIPGTQPSAAHRYPVASQ